MDGLSAAASGIAVVSVAVQLAESFKKLCDFWTSVKEAPEDIRAMSADLEILSNVLIQMARDTQHVEPDASLIAALNGCCVNVKILNTILNGVEPGFSSTKCRVRQWSAFKAVLKRGELLKFQVALDRTKATLLLVQQQHQYSRLNRICQNSLEMGLATITQKFSRMSVQNGLEMIESDSSVASNAVHVEEQRVTGSYPVNGYIAQSGPPNSGENRIVPQKKAMVRRTLHVSESVMEGFLGSIRATSATVLGILRQTADLTPYHEQDQHEYKTSYTISPAPWLVRLGFHYGLHLGFLSFTQGLKTTLQTFCPVPDDALIFEFCKEGNVSAVRRLFSRGHASVRDTDSRGYTPLHFAAQTYNSELCRFLKSAGADTATLTHDAETPIRLAADQADRIMDCSPITASEVFDTFRLLTDSVDLSKETGNGWEVLNRLSEASDGTVASKVLLWMLRLFSFELEINIVEKHFAYMLYRLFFYDLEPERVEASDLLLNLGGPGIIDAHLRGPNGYTVLHNVLFHWASEDHVSAVVAKGPDLHLRCFDTYYTSFEESPTSLAMYSAIAFSTWLRALASVNVDLKHFLDQELERNPEIHAGWDKESLLELFTHGDRPDLYDEYDWTCSDCLEESFVVEVQPYWRHLLERIKGRMHPYEPVSAVSEVDEDESDDIGSLGAAASSSTDLTPELDTTGNVTFLNPDEVPANLESERKSGEEPKLVSDAGISENSAITPIGSVCLYGKHAMVCFDCWLHYKRTGTRYQRGEPAADEDSSEIEDAASSDDSSECEYSPFLIHS